MLFNSYKFIFLFLPITFSGFFLLGRLADKRLATLWLVLASLFFYGYWDWHYVPLLSASILFNYFIGKNIERRIQKKYILYLGIGVDVMLLGYFKYVDFFLNTVNLAAGSRFELLNVVLPLGISLLAGQFQFSLSGSKHYRFLAQMAYDAGRLGA